MTYNEADRNASDVFCISYFYFSFSEEPAKKKMLISASYESRLFHLICVLVDDFPREECAVLGSCGLSVLANTVFPAVN